MKSFFLTLIIIVLVSFNVRANYHFIGADSSNKTLSDTQNVIQTIPREKISIASTTNKFVPTLTITSPTAHDFIEGTNIDIDATLSEIADITRVVLLIDNNPAQEWPPSQYSFHLTAVNARAGNYAIKFVAYNGNAIVCSTADFSIIVTTPTTATAWNTTGNGALPNTAFFGNVDNQPIRFRTNNLERLTIKEDGKIGIGTLTPQAVLDVNGNIFSSGKIAIGTTEVNKFTNYSLAVNGSAIFTKAVVRSYTANGGWPDYVFDNNYKLSPLKEVEQFIKINKHLPEVPSASEVEKNGIDLGNSQGILLKKIEELTLYVIEQSKQIEKQQEDIKALKCQLQSKK